MTKKGQPSDDVSSAPESGTVRDSTSGNKPSDRGNSSGAAGTSGRGKSQEGGQNKDDPSHAGEEP